MITIANEKSIMKGNYKEPKEHKAIQSLANENEQVLILQVDGMYELRMKRRGK